MTVLNLFFSIIATVSLTLLMSCGGETPQEERRTDTSGITSSADLPKTEKGNASGERLYKVNCVVCHQKNGKGMEGLYPPIAETDWVNGDKGRLIGVLLNGLQGEIVVNGETYNNLMASYKHLSNEEIASLLTYIRSNFGNHAEPIQAEEVAAIRAKS